MQISKPSVWAGLFSAAIFTLSSAIALAAPSINGTYAAVTPQSVELLTLRNDKKSGIHGAYRVLHLNATQETGLDDQSVALSAPGLAPEAAFTLGDTRSMILRFDAGFKHAEATTHSLPASQTPSFSRVSAEQVQLLLEMARYGGLFEVCQAHRTGSASAYSRTFCAGMAPQLTDIVPFRPFPNAGASHPVLAYEVKARLDHSLAFNR
ncbi:MAG: hypothetical protein NVSMB31_06340 [Vulcanimicrobiaceae bacterium]